MKGMEDDPLAFLSLDDLFKEIEKRTKASVLVVINKDNMEKSEEAEAWFHGGMVQAIGLLERQKWCFQKYVQEGYRFQDREDDGGFDDV